MPGVGRRNEAPRVIARLLWGAAPPHTPIREERALRAARPTHPPSDFLSVGAPPPRPRPNRPPGRHEGVGRPLAIERAG